MKKIFIALLFVVLVTSGAFAQLMIGLSGALHMDTKLSGSEISDRFQQGDGIFYGPSIEYVGKNFGVGFAGNFSFYKRDVTFTDGGYTWSRSMGFTDYDMTLYLSYHALGGHAFLDPFGELGGGLLATGFTDSADRDTYSPYDGSFLFASYYWYAALGCGVNLGPIGIFGKFSFNYPFAGSYRTTWRNTDVKTDLYPYGYDEVLFPDGYLPKFRFTIGAKMFL
jgi:hypothetical protein